MFTISVRFLGQYPPRAAYSKMSIDEIYDYLPWEADLTITYNNQIMFSEEIAIIEFYWYLANWYRKFLVEDKEPFVFATVEHLEPILVFSPQQNRYWTVDSTWRRCDEPALIKEDALYSEVRNLLEKIMSAIEE